MTLEELKTLSDAYKLEQRSRRREQKRDAQEKVCASAIIFSFQCDDDRSNIMPPRPPCILTPNQKIRHRANHDH